MSQPVDCSAFKGVLVRNPLSVLPQVTTWKLEQSNFKNMIDTRNLKESLIRGANLFETFDDEQVAKLAACLIRRVPWLSFFLLNFFEHL